MALAIILASGVSAAAADRIVLGLDWQVFGRHAGGRVLLEHHDARITDAVARRDAKEAVVWMEAHLFQLERETARRNRPAAGDSRQAGR